MRVTVCRVVLLLGGQYACREQDPEVEVLRDQPQEGTGDREVVLLCRWKDPEGKPQERDRHEIRPAEFGRMKTLRA